MPPGARADPERLHPGPAGRSRPPPSGKVGGGRGPTVRSEKEVPSVSIQHIVEAGYVVVEPIRDPLEQPTWLPAASNDLLAYATPIIGPLSTLIVHRMAWYFASGDD